MVSLNPILRVGREALQLCIVSVAEEKKAADAGQGRIARRLTDGALFPAQQQRAPFFPLPQSSCSCVGTVHLLGPHRLWVVGCLGWLPSGPLMPHSPWEGAGRVVHLSGYPQHILNLS